MDTHTGTRIHMHNRCTHKHTYTQLDTDTGTHLNKDTSEEHFYKEQHIWRIKKRRDRQTDRPSLALIERLTCWLTDWLTHSVSPSLSLTCLPLISSSVRFSFPFSYQPRPIQCFILSHRYRIQINFECIRVPHICNTQFVIQDKSKSALSYLYTARGDCMGHRNLTPAGLDLDLSILRGSFTFWLIAIQC